ncbi:hypothetical protein Kpol_483p7 [Vanderwaltozyma polyspora DSM 70294]|uniref:Tyrosine specific protein phosphatases domain-containing protein n=1 Tax=Vanderwaltozyma polyspora (strain ATCC 22028 / DSM 70294 / BCRC 21397 / CBS 2163 / NBRC 10782 / NRRL Y-8283 / UCD 57-17) TaxID=436907 RepID=A7TQ59_VANPO|nr:uncharacterized protein Kpol_483p7 [Vanderwaltozyma polyspora DSM 70294]EDO15588.1 hypothetical protein Kpol_483p7 [Vanderwaltozyma polyspora DSM 70294]
MRDNFNIEHDGITCTFVETPPSYIKLEPNEEFLYIKNSKYHLENGIACILTYPSSLKLYHTFKERIKHENIHNLANHRFVLLLHGMQSHKNAVYQPLLASKLSDLGYFTLRLDFRGNGDSEPCSHNKTGRNINIDLEDIGTIYSFIKNSKIFLNHSLSFDTIVAHSRSVISMFQFLIENPTIYIPNLINCSGRFDGLTLLERLQNKHPHLEKENGFWCTLLRYGEIVNSWIPLDEMLSFINTDSKEFDKINNNCWVLSCYGSKEQIIPLESASHFANTFIGRHCLQIIDGADHNFYGLPDDQNLSNLPLRKGKVNYGVLLTSKIIDHLSWQHQLERFYKITEYIDVNPNNMFQNPSVKLSRWPLEYNYSKVSNFRDIGGYLTIFQNRRVKSGLLFRSANPCDITQNALHYMQSTLNIRHVFDLRSQEEALENGIINVDAPGYNMKVEKLPFNKNVSMSPDMMAEHFQSLLISAQSFPKTYMIILKESIEEIRIFFQFIIDGHCNKKNAVMYHCTAGKDRTGILTMLILSILGVEDDLIAKEYELTTIGLKTEEKLYKKIEARSDLYVQMFSRDPNRIIQEYNLTPQKMCKNLLSSRYEAMRIFIEEFNREYNSIDEFFIKQLQFSLHDIGKLRDILLE